MTPPHNTGAGRLDRAMGDCPRCGGDCTPMCDDQTCRSNSCRVCAIEAWEEAQQEAARVYVRTLLGLPL